jgi:glycosyltransferase involved in cell wall biosynthesis
MMQLLQLFKQEGYTITFGTTAASSTNSVAQDDDSISWVPLQLNDASFDELISSLNPQVVLFDRYITEEQFGWRVAEQCPNALRVLDTEDLHFLRKARQEAVKRGENASEANLFSEGAKRELASILRSDVSLIISEVEMELLRDTFKIPNGLIYYLPLFAEFLSAENQEQLPTYSKRAHFISIGNFRHAPNLDAVLQLKQFIWPSIRAQLPAAELHVYGQYAPQQVTQLHDEVQGFLLKGWAPSVDVVMQTARVSLAPLRFGAGIKGKIIDAMRLGTPAVTTAIGAEGIHAELPFAGIVSGNTEAFVSAAIQLYANETSWQRASEAGYEIIQKRFQSTLFSEAFMSHIEALTSKLSSHRSEHFIGQILQQQTTQASKYLSKWIEVKNK